MGRKVAETILNASTIDILNVIRANAPQEYQDSVPVVTREEDIPVVGEIILGHPAFANYALNAMLNRIALTRIVSKVYNNPYKNFKKGKLDFGHTIEEVYVNISKARQFSAEKGKEREFKRTIPDVRAAFHVVNWKVMYPITIEWAELEQAFTTADGLIDLQNKIVESLVSGEEYDEYLLFKYLIIKAVAHGKMYPIGVDMSDIHNAAIAFRGTSNKLEFMSREYNQAGVDTFTTKEDQYIFMDADFNAQFDVNVLASAFNMDKADFMGKLKLIDDFTTFDNDRFDYIRQESTGLEEVTAAELALMADVKAILLDQEWFQVYDKKQQMTETPVNSGLYWNYFYHIWMVLSSSPFANAVVFVDSSTSDAAPTEVTLKVTEKQVGTDNKPAIIVVEPVFTDPTMQDTVPTFLQTEECTEAGVAVQRYGVFMWNIGEGGAVSPSFVLGGKTFTTTDTLDPAETVVGDTLTCEVVT